MRSPSSANYHFKDWRSVDYLFLVDFYSTFETHFRQQAHRACRRCDGKADDLLYVFGFYRRILRETLRAHFPKLYQNRELHRRIDYGLTKGPTAVILHAQRRRARLVVLWYALLVAQDSQSAHGSCDSATVSLPGLVGGTVEPHKVRVTMPHLVALRQTASACIANVKKNLFPPLIQTSRVWGV